MSLLTVDDFSLELACLEAVNVIVAFTGKYQNGDQIFEVLVADAQHREHVMVVKAPVGRRIWEACKRVWPNVPVTVG